MANMYLEEARFLETMQEKLSNIGDMIVPISSIGDPSKGFTIYFPMFLAMNYLKGVRFLGAFIISEWINMNGKWLLHGQRPYWWVKENRAAADISLLQTPLTCETGPGVPSGHSQAAALIVYCLLDILAPRRSKVSSLILFLVFMLMQSSMWISRLYISAHFPHQCLLGCVVGVAAARKYYLHGSWMQWRKVSLVVGSIMLFVTSMSVYLGLSWTGHDANWSIQLAQKHCQNPDWIYIDTTPFYGMMRFTGSALGLSISGFLTMDVFTTPSTLTKMTAMVMGLGLGQIAHFVHMNIPREPLYTFYFFEIILNTVYVILVVKCYQLLFSYNICGNQRANSKKKSCY